MVYLSEVSKRVIIYQKGVNSMKVLRNVLLKGVISKKKALELLNAKGWTDYEIIFNWRGKDIIITRDDMNCITIDLFDAKHLECVGGVFE